MCGTCENAHARRWTSTRVTLLAFVATLFILSTAGLAGRARSSESRALHTCDAASAAAVGFQSNVTRDLRDHSRLHADARRFVGELRSLGAIDCPATQRFLRAGSNTLAALCLDCAVELRRIRLSAT